MSDSLWTGHRQERWWWEILDTTGAAIGTLDGVEDGADIELNLNATIKGGGSLVWSGTPEQQPNWAQIQVRPWYVLRRPDGTETATPWGIYIPQTPSEHHDDGTVTVDVEFYDRTLRLDQDRVDQIWTAPAGTNLVELLTNLITARFPYIPVSIADSDTELTQPRSFPPGTRILEIVNTLLTGPLNYTSIAADLQGVLRSGPYRSASDRPTAWTFEDGPRGIYEPQFDHERDLFSVPNRVVLVGQTDGETPALVAVAENTHPNSPTSYEALGNTWIVHTEEDVEAPDQETLDALAQRRLESLSAVYEAVNFAHALLPLEPGDVIRFCRNTIELDLLATVQTVTVSTELGESAQTRVRRVVDV